MVDEERSRSIVYGANSCDLDDLGHRQAGKVSYCFCMKMLMKSDKLPWAKHPQNLWIIIEGVLRPRYDEAVWTINDIHPYLCALDFEHQTP
jgi:hypothetical protein